MSKANAISEEQNQVPRALSSEQFVIERLNLQNQTLKHGDKTTQLILLWNGLGEELKTARKATFDHAVIGINGDVEVINPDGLAVAWNLIEARENQLYNAEQGIRMIIGAGGQFLRDLENTTYIHSQTEVHDKRRLDGLFIELQRRNPDLPPDKISSLPDYTAFKKEMDAEIQQSREILESARATIDIYNKAFELAGI
jgi:hypothetical protein